MSLDSGKRSFMNRLNVSCICLYSPERINADETFRVYGIFSLKENILLAKIQLGEMSTMIVPHMPLWKDTKCLIH